MAIKEGDHPTFALAEARRIMVEMGKRDGDSLAEHKAAGVAWDGVRLETNVTAVKPDGTLVELRGESMAVRGGEQTLFVPDRTHTTVFAGLFKRHARHV